MTGTGFAPGVGATNFHFGRVKATSVDCSSSTACTVLAPAQLAGEVDVKAGVDKVGSPPSPPGDRFTYTGLYLTAGRNRLPSGTKILAFWYSVFDERRDGCYVYSEATIGENGKETDTISVNAGASYCSGAQLSGALNGGIELNVSSDGIASVTGRMGLTEEECVYEALGLSGPFEGTREFGAFLSGTFELDEQESSPACVEHGAPETQQVRLTVEMVSVRVGPEEFPLETESVG